MGVEVGDLFEQSGNIVIGCADTFDTQFEDSVISPESVQGQFLSRVFDGDRDALDKELATSLADSPGTVDASKTFGKTTRYERGTVATVARGSARYFLVAFTRMSPDKPAHVTSSIESLQVALARTWEALATSGQRKPVHLPIIGSNLARLGVSRTLLIEMIILSFIAAEKRGHVAASLTIWVSHDDAHIVDMAALDEWLRCLCAS